MKVIIPIDQKMFNFFLDKNEPIELSTKWTLKGNLTEEIHYLETHIPIIKVTSSFDKFFDKIQNLKILLLAIHNHFRKDIDFDSQPMLSLEHKEHNLNLKAFYYGSNELSSRPMDFHCLLGKINLTKEVQGDIVELGVDTGITTNFMGLAAKKFNKKVYGIDNFREHGKERNIKGEYELIEEDTIFSGKQAKKYVSGDRFSTVMLTTKGANKPKL